MPLIRRAKRPAEPPPERLADLEFLALVKASLEAYVPGVTRGAELRGNSLISPQGWRWRSCRPGMAADATTTSPRCRT